MTVYGQVRSSKMSPSDKKREFSQVLAYTEIIFITFVDYMCHGRDGDRTTNFVFAMPNNTKITLQEKQP